MQILNFGDDLLPYTNEEVSNKEKAEMEKDVDSSNMKPKIKVWLVCQNGNVTKLGEVSTGEVAKLSAEFYKKFSETRLIWSNNSEEEKINNASRLFLDYFWLNGKEEAENILVISDKPGLWRHWWETTKDIALNFIELDENLNKKFKPSPSDSKGRLTLLSCKQLRQLKKGEAQNLGLDTSFCWTLLIIDGWDSMHSYRYDASSNYAANLQNINLKNILFLLPDFNNIASLSPSKAWEKWVQNEKNALKEGEDDLSPELQQEFWIEKNEKIEEEIDKAKHLFSSLEASYGTAEENLIDPTLAPDPLSLNRYIAPPNAMSYSEACAKHTGIYVQTIINKLIDKFPWGKKFLSLTDLSNEGGKEGNQEASNLGSNSSGNALSLWNALGRFFGFPENKLYEKRNDISNMVQILETVKNFVKDAPSTSSEDDFLSLLKEVPPLDLNGKPFKNFPLQNESFEPDRQHKAADNLLTSAIDEGKRDDKKKLSMAASMPDSALVQKYEEVLRRNKNLILHGAPGTGKTYLAKNIAAYLVSDEKCPAYHDLDKGLRERIEFLQFHPDYDYTDFVEGYQPGIPVGNALGFNLESGLFKKFVEKAIDNPYGKYVLIIDEINRGNLSSIFGDLFSILEPGHRGSEWTVKLKYSKTDFYIPKNVYIIGTMNNIDRSVEPLDFAFRRRWTFKEIRAEESAEEILNAIKNPELRSEALKKMLSLNAEIGNDLGSDYQIGGAYFLKLKDNGGNFDYLWEDDLQPLLQDYVRGMENENLMNAFESAYRHPQKGSLLENEEQNV